MKSWEVNDDAWEAFDKAEDMCAGIQAAYEAGIRAAGVAPQPEPDGFWEYKEVGRGGEYVTYRRPKWSAPVGAWEPVPNHPNI